VRQTGDQSASWQVFDAGSREELERVLVTFPRTRM
jgi:hypothetical protein